MFLLVSLITVLVLIAFAIWANSFELFVIAVFIGLSALIFWLCFVVCKALLASFIRWIKNL